MALSAQSVLAKRHTTTIEIDGEKLTATYRPHTVAERERMLQRIRENAGEAETAYTKGKAQLRREYASAREGQEAIGRLLSKLDRGKPDLYRRPPEG